MSRYVITGASGHIGNNLVRSLRERYPHAQIVVLTRRPITRELDGIECEQSIGDLCDERLLQKNIMPEDCVVHLAGLIDLTNRHTQELYRINVDATRLICDVCRQKGVQRFLYVGSVDAIAKTDCADVITEPSCYDPDSVAGAYGKTKAIAAQYVLEQIQRHPEFSAAIVLPSAVIGPHDYKPSAVGKVLKDVLTQKPQFGLRGGYNFVDVRDVCDAIISLLHSTLREQYILCGHNVTVQQLYFETDHILSIKKRPIILPLLLAYLAIPFVSALNPITLKALREPHHYSYQKAKQDLAYAPRPFEQTLCDTLAWFQENSEK